MEWNLANGSIRFTLLKGFLKKIALDECVAKAKKHKQRFILHMDNSPVHKSKIVQEFIQSHGMFMPPHPALFT